VLAPEALAHMTDIMAHRGPDDRGFHLEPGVAIGARRLSIVDVEGGHQPFANEDGTIWAAQNGELYNHRDLRARLQRDGHVFRSRCDTEILPHLYEDAGSRFARHLRGMFAVVLWDGRRRRAVLVRDRLGIKPLYWTQVGDLVVFGSELKSVLASGLVPVELDIEAIDAYLTLGIVPGPRSPIAGVAKLMPGEQLVIDERGVRAERYWHYPEPTPGPARLGIGHYADELLEKLEESVRLRLMADVPLGAMLSGGLDSSLVVALMARLSSGPVETFSIGFADGGEANELDDARHVAEVFGTNHHALELSLADQTVDLAELMWHMDEPLADLSSLGFLALCELARRHVTVALSGQGADELFGGYLKHKAAALCNHWERLPAPLRQAGGVLAPHARGRFRRAAKTLAAPEAATRLLEMSGKLDPALRAEMVRGPLADAKDDPALAAIRAALGPLQARPLATTLYLDAQLALVDDMLHYFDRASMAHSLEVRVPFLDHELVELAATIPERFKVRRLQGKAVLKHAARGIVPDRIIDKPKLGFFRDSVGPWFRAQTDGAIKDYLLAPDARYAEMLDPGRVRELISEHAAGSGDTAHQHLLLAVLLLEVWLSTFVPRATAGADTTRLPRLEASPA
jgi:asparagine synthase (glutamine-hydrolysing)